MHNYSFTRIWLLAVILGCVASMACVMDAEDWNKQHEGAAAAAGASGTGGTCTGNCGTGGSGGNSQICTPGLWVDGTCPGGSKGLYRCNAQGNGFDQSTCNNGVGGSGGGNNCGPVCCPNTTVTISCPNNATGTATCNAQGTGYNIQCNGGQGGSGGTAGCGGTGGSTGGQGGSGGFVPAGDCQGNGVNHSMRVVCSAPSSEFAVIDIKGGGVVYGDHSPDQQAKWCEAWYPTPLATSTVQGGNTILDYNRQVQGHTAPRFQTYLRATVSSPDGNTPHGFSYPEIQLPADATCQVFLDGTALTDSKGQPLPCQTVGCAKLVINVTNDPEWKNMQVDVN